MSEANVTKENVEHLEVLPGETFTFDNEEMMDHHGITLRVIAVYLVHRIDP